MPSSSSLRAATLASDYGRLPVAFEVNQGQAPAWIDFQTVGAGYALGLSATDAVLSLRHESADGTQPSLADQLQLELVGANSAAIASGQEPLITRSNYLIGSDPSQWHTNIPNYGEVEYQNVYPGVNLIYYGNQGQLEYDFDVAPGANPGVIALRFQGKEGLSLDGEGGLVIHTAGGDVYEHAPVVYQESGGVRHDVAGQYVVGANGKVNFAVGAHDPALALVIDPVLSYSTYLGGSSEDDGYAIAVDSAGNAYVAGATGSSNFPTTAGAFQRTLTASQTNVFVTKFNASGTALVYSTYLGGTTNDYAKGIAVNSAGDVYVVGVHGINFPTTAGAYSRTLGETFVTELNASGSALVYSTYLGGSGEDIGNAIVLDSTGNAYITGTTASSDFATTAGAFQRTYAGSFDGFVTKLNASGSALVYSTYLGGSGEDDFRGIAIDNSGNAYVTGLTGSTNFPTTAGAFQTTAGGGWDAFVTKLNASGSGLVYSTYLRGSGDEFGLGIAVDSAGNAYVTGKTNSTNFPTTAGAFQTMFAGGTGPDAFVTKLNTLGSALVYSTYLGGGDSGNGIAIDTAGNAYVAGTTSSTNFPTTAGAFQTALGGSSGNAFVTELNPSGSGLLYSTYLGGSGGDSGNGIALDTAGDIFVTGNTSSTNFPTTAGAFQTTNAGVSNGPDAFVAKFAAGAAAASTLAVSGFLSPTTAGVSHSFTVTAEDSSGNTVTSYTGTVTFTSSDVLAGLPANYTFVSGDAGVHTFSATLKTAGTQSITATDTATSTIKGSQTGITVNPAAASALVVGGFPSPTVSGVSHTFTVTALDPYGNVATGYTGTVHFTSTDSGSALPADYTFLGSDGGVHSFSATLETAGTQSLTATDTVTASITGTEANILVKPASFLMSGFPSPTTAGVAHSFSVTAENANGTTATGYAGTVHFTSGDGQAVLPADYTFVSADAGVHTFSATLKTAGTQSITATDTVTSTITGSQTGINVNAAALSKLAVAGFPSPTVAGVTNSFTVTAEDAYGNTVTSYLGTVHFTSTDKKAVLPANYTFAASDAGAHTFSATFKTAGTQAITAKDTVKTTIGGTESGIMVNPAATSHLQITAPTSSTAGVAFSITVTALDPYGNIAPNYTGTVHFTSSDKKAVLPANYTFAGTDAGVHIFSNGVTLKTAGSQTVTAADTATATINGKASIKISAAAVDHFKIATVTSTTAGNALSVTVTAQDAFNNTVTGYLGTIHFTSSDGQAILPADYTFAATDKGVHTFTSGVTLKTAGTQTVTATDKATSSVTGSASIKVAAAKASTFRITAPSSVTHGVAFTFTVTALDAYGNVATGYTGTVHFTSSDTAASLPANFTFLSGDAGVETFSAILNTTGNQSLTATDTVTASITGTDPAIQVM